MADLHGENLILLNQPFSAQYFMRLLRARSAVPLVVARLRGLELQRSLVANGFGVALAHTLPPAETTYDGMPIIGLPLSDELIAQRVLTACHRHSETRPILKAVQAEMLAEFAAE